MLSTYTQHTTQTQYYDHLWLIYLIMYNMQCDCSSGNTVVSSTPLMTVSTTSTSLLTISTNTTAVINQTLIISISVAVAAGAVILIVVAVLIINSIGVVYKKKDILNIKIATIECDLLVNNDMPVDA